MNLFRNFSIKTRLLVAFLLSVAFPITVYTYTILSKVEVSLHTIIFLGIVSILIAIMSAILVSTSVIAPIFLIINALQTFQTKKSAAVLRDNGDDEIAEVSAELNRIFADWNREIVSLGKKQFLQEKECEKSQYQISLAEQQLIQTRSLLTAARLLNTTFDFQTNLKTILDEAVRSLNVQWASILLINREKNEMTVACVRGMEQSLLDTLEEDDYPSVRLKPHEGLAGFVIKEGLPLIANKGCKDPRFKHFNEFKDKDNKIAGLLCAPISDSEGNVLGVMNFVNRIVPPVFRNEDLAYVSDLCLLASLVIERNRMYTNLFTDVDTGLTAHNVWKGYLSEESARSIRYAQNLTLVVFEIDNFKNIAAETNNDFIDNILKNCGKSLSTLLRETDKASSVQERFFCMLPNTEISGGVFFAGRVKELIEAETHTFSGKKYELTLSAGIACYPMNVNEPNLLLKASLKALTKAKEQGGNKAALYTREK
ncbi:MAG: diguanylate cyclase domain-containing protein [Candidatus Ozemobacteraceae bacterium]